ncbi:MAG TPA: DNA gyrase subunit A [Caldilineae bacterium]|nr:DNA gyrase subunit A [Caldilineae bacterium]
MTQESYEVEELLIEEEMKDAYLTFAMSVIISRALPDVRDGLKPVHRRILYAMHSMGLRHDKSHRKSARIVGEVLGKFHPHGDSAVYDAMVRMAQDFSMRYPLVDGQGNFGSIDGDSAAAMRYTEARLTEIAEEMLADLDKETVDYGPNFDETLTEPLVLPSALPNLLLNGASGIAVGMATNIAPHNLNEVIDALAFIIDHYHAVDEITLGHLMYFIKGPDFPTGGLVYRYREGKNGHEDIIAQAYAGGRGRLLVQAKVHVEAMSRNRNRLVVTELPYQTNKTRLIERIANLVRDGKIEGLTDLRDESDRQGMRIIIELTRNVDPDDILKALYKLTPMQQTFGIINLALVNGQPRLLSLKRMLLLFLDHRQEIIRRRSEYELARARARAHIVEGLLIALAHLDDVIATIRRSPDTDTARGRLMRKFKLSEVQAQAILDMQLKRLSKLERDKLQAEHKALLERIRYLEDLLAHPEKILSVIKQDLLALKEKYGDSRRSQIVDRQGVALTASEFLSDEEVLVLLTKKGKFFRQSLAGRRRGSLPRRVADAPIVMAAAPARDSVFLFTAAGQAVQKRIHQIPDDDNIDFSEITELRSDDDVVAMLALAPPADGEPDHSIFLTTQEGRCKRIAVSELWSAAHTSPMVMNVEEGDALVSAVLCDTNDDLLLITRLGQAIRFAQDEVRVMGLSAAGVLAMKLSAGDQIAGADLCKPGHQALLLTTYGYGMRTSLIKFPSQKRYGSGVKGMSLTRNHGAVEALAVVEDAHEMFVIMNKGAMRVLRLDDAPAANRGGRGRQIASLKGSEVERLLALIIPKVKGSDGADEPPPPPPPPPPPKRTTRRPARKAAAATVAASTAKAKSPARSSTTKKTTTPASAKPAAKTKTSTSTRRTRRVKKPAAKSTTQKAPAKRTTSTSQKKTTSTAKPAAKTTKSPAKTSPKSQAKAKPAAKKTTTTRKSSAKPKSTRAKPGSLASIKKRVQRKRKSKTPDPSVQPKLPLD